VFDSARSSALYAVASEFALVTVAALVDKVASLKTLHLANHVPMPQLLRRFLSLVILGSLVGCASYIPPGAKADLQAFAPASIQEGFAAKPTAPFPASVAFVRVQGPTYSNYRLQQTGGVYGTGRYSVVTTREVEEEVQIDRIAKLPQIAGITGLNRMLLPEKLQGDREIREAAARLQADLVFIYTFDTVFFEKDLARPLTVITLGLSPTAKVFVTVNRPGFCGGQLV